MALDPDKSPEQLRDELAALRQEYGAMEKTLKARTTELLQMNRELLNDIAERNKALAELHASEEKYRLLFNSMISGFALHEMIFTEAQVPVDYRFLGVNPAFEKLTGLSAGRIIGRTVKEILPGIEPIWIDTYGKVVTTGQPVRFEEYAAALDKYFEVVAFRPEPGKFACIFQDITERKKSALALRESEARFRTLFESSRDAGFIADNDQKLLEINSAMLELMACSRSDLLGKNLSEIFEDPELAAIVCETLHQQETIKDYEIEVRNRKSALLSCQISASLRRDADDRIIGCQGFIRDITETKRTAMQLRQSQKLEAIGTLAGGIAHDFNNILTAILGFTELANEDLADGKNPRSNLFEVYKAGTRAKELVQQILMFSRGSSNKPVPVHMRLLVIEALKLMRASLPTTIHILQDIEPESGMINADPTQIHQVLINLCTNAAHAMAENGGTLSVGLANVTLGTEELPEASWFPPGNYARLTVSDTGSGIEPAILEKIFDPYFTTKETGKGTGMGLAVVNGIIQKHGGFIQVTSKPGQGSTFQAFFPVIVQAGINKPAMQDSLGGTERILLVDDEEFVVRMAKEILTRLGYRVTSETNSRKALDLFLEAPDQFDLVITDQTMPELTGEALARQLLDRRPGLPIVLCTGYSEKFSEETAKSMGIREYIFKPLTKKNLASAVRHALKTQLENQP